MTGCKSLDTLSCDYNSLTELDLTGCSSLRGLYVQSNNLTKINFDDCELLAAFCCFSNNLTSLDVSKHINLTELNCRGNNLSSLDVSKNINLKNLNCSSDRLMSLDVSKNINLTELDCSYNKLTSLDVSKNTALIELNCYSNKLTSLDVSNNTNLTLLDCHSNKLTSLDVSKNINLTELNCSSNNLPSLDVSKNINLTELDCIGNNLSSLDVSNCEQLVSLSCYDNMLKKIDANSCTKLENFYCNNNQLNSLDLSNCNIKKLWLENNPIAAINCSNDLSSRSNRLDFCPVSENESTFDITKYGGDPTRIGTVTGGELVNNIIKPNEGTDTVTYEYKYNSNSESVINCTVYFSEEGKELIYINKENFPDDHFRDYVINNLKDASNNYVGKDGVLKADEIAEVKEISVSYRSISDLKGIEYFTALTDLYCYRNQLKSLDVSKNTELTKLYCFNNNLKSLDLSNNTKLTELECSSNFLTKLDLSKNTLLTKLYCRFNPLTSLDLSATAVTDLSANTELKEYAYKTVFDGGKLDLTTLDGFDVSKADSWDNATIEGNIISIIDPTEPVAYFYDTGREKDAWFMIAAESVSLTADMIEVEDQTYTGEKIEPKPVVKCGNYTLVEGTDYTLSYDKNTDAGTGKVIVTAKGDFYTGSAEAEFKINKAEPKEIVLPTASGLIYGQKLSESVLSDENWKWVDGKVIPTVNNDGYEASIIVDDKNYEIGRASCRERV